MQFVKFQDKMFNYKVLILIIVLAEFKLTFAGWCLTVCWCSGTGVDCARKSLTNVPRGYPNTSTIINMQINNIAYIPHNSFGNLSYLDTLRLDNNKISSIAPRAFYGLPVLNELQLSNNEITTIPVDIVEPTALLSKGIKLINNKLTRFPLALLLKTRTFIAVSSNPITCDCLSVIPAQLKVKAIGTCDSPPALKGRDIKTITAKDVNCDVCFPNPCKNGICDTRNGKTILCFCFNGFTGAKCEYTVKENDTKPTQGPFGRMITNPKLAAVSRNTGGSLHILGWEFKLYFPVAEVSCYWLIDYHIKIPVNIYRVAYTNNTNMYKVADLFVNKTNYTHQGTYEAFCKYPSGKVYIKTIYIQYHDLSTTLVVQSYPNLAWKKDLMNTTTLYYQMVEQKVKEDIRRALIGVKVPKQPIISLLRINRRKGDGGNGTVSTAKVIFTNLTDTERLKYCNKLQKFILKIKAANAIATSMDCCFNSTIGDDELKGKYYYSITLISSVPLIKQCKYGPDDEKITRVCTHNVFNQPEWEHIDLSKCLSKYKTKTSKELAELTKTSICSTRKQSNCTTVNKLTTMLSETVSNGSILTAPSDIEDITYIIYNIIRHTDNYTIDKNQIFTDILQVTSNMLDADISLIATSQIITQSSTRMLKNLEKLGPEIADTLTQNNNSYFVSKKNIALLVTDFQEGDIKLYAMYENNTIGIYSTKRTQVVPVQTLASITIPKEASMKSERSYIYSFYYRNINLFLYEEKLKQFSGQNYASSLVLQSKVFTASIGNKRISNLTKPITLKFQNTLPLFRNKTCWFWDFRKKTALKNVFGGWSNEDCWKVTGTDNGYITCQCNHLTNFALIMNVNQDINNPMSLKLITWIGCGISIASLSITIVIHLLLPNIRRKLAPKILICLCASLLVTLILFLSGANRKSSSLHCQVNAVLLQYFVLTTFCWMAVEGFNLYRNFVIIFKTTNNDNLILLKSSLFAWGVPLIIVAISTGLYPQGMQSDIVCIVRGYSFYYGTLLPVCIILVCNWIVLVLALKGMRKSTILVKAEDKSKYWRQLWRVILCTTILGLTWTFAVVAVGNLRDVFQWMFCIFNSLQGFSLFLLFVLFNKGVRNELVKCLRRNSSNRKIR